MSDPVRKSDKLANVCYDIRGAVLEAAQRMEAEGKSILKLNIGNPGAFDFEAPGEITDDVVRNLSDAQGYGDSRGLFAARKAVMQHCQRIGIDDVDVDDIYIGNGASELIQIAVQALLNTGDEVLVPTPDYPLWTACIELAGGRSAHYRCLEEAGWEPDLDDLRAKINERTRALVVINPNNPTGAVYSEATLAALAEIARQHNLILFADEIYEKILYDGVRHQPLAALAPDLLCATFGSLSKNYRLAGFRVGWMIISGKRRADAKDYIEGLNILTSMRLCANMPGQYAVQTALGGTQSIEALTAPGGRLHKQRALAHAKLTAMDGIESCHLPQGGIYLFPKLDSKLGIENDEDFVIRFLEQSHILMVPGSAFNWPQPDHFRIVFLPDADRLEEALDMLAQFIASL